MKKDGLIDILIGFLFFCYGIYVFSINNPSSFIATLKASPLFITSLYCFAYIILVLLGLTMYLLNKSREEYREEKGRRNNLLVSLLLFVTYFFFTFWLVILPFRIYLYGIYLPTMMLACFILSLFFLLGYANNFKRLYLYGLVIGLSFPLINFLDRFFPIHQLFVWFIIVPSGIIIFYGISLLKQYLSLYPLDLSVFKSDKKPTIIKIEREVKATFYQDGLKDIERGIFLFFFGFLRYLGQEYLSVIYFLLFIILSIIISSRIDLMSSRVGKVRMKLQVVKKRNPEKDQLIQALTLIILISYLFFGLFFSLNNFSNPLGGYAKYLDNLSILVFFFSISLISQAKNYKISRLYLYFIFYNFSLPLYFFLLNHFSKPLSILISYGLPSIIMILIGISVMIRFLKKYPVVKQNEA